MEKFSQIKGKDLINLESINLDDRVNNIIESSLEVAKVLGSKINNFESLLNIFKKETSGLQEKLSDKKSKISFKDYLEIESRKKTVENYHEFEGNISRGRGVVSDLNNMALYFFVIKIKNSELFITNNESDSNKNIITVYFNKSDLQNTLANNPIIKKSEKEDYDSKIEIKQLHITKQECIDNIDNANNFLQTLNFHSGKLSNINKFGAMSKDNIEYKNDIYVMSGNKGFKFANYIDYYNTLKDVIIGENLIITPQKAQESTNPNAVLEIDNIAEKNGLVISQKLQQPKAEEEKSKIYKPKDGIRAELIQEKKEFFISDTIFGKGLLQICEKIKSVNKSNDFNITEAQDKLAKFGLAIESEQIKFLSETFFKTLQDINDFAKPHLKKIGLEDIIDENTNYVNNFSVLTSSYYQSYAKNDDKSSYGYCFKNAILSVNDNSVEVKFNKFAVHEDGFKGSSIQAIKQENINKSFATIKTLSEKCMDIVHEQIHANDKKVFSFTENGFRIDGLKPFEIKFFNELQKDNSEKLARYLIQKDIKNSTLLDKLKLGEAGVSIDKNVGKEFMLYYQQKLLDLLQNISPSFSNSQNQKSDFIKLDADTKNALQQIVDLAKQSRQK